MKGEEARQHKKNHDTNNGRGDTLIDTDNSVWVKIKMGSQKKPPFVVLANFHCAKTPTVVDFKLTMCKILKPKVGRNVPSSSQLQHITW